MLSVYYILDTVLRTKKVCLPLRGYSSLTGKTTSKFCTKLNGTVALVTSIMFQANYTYRRLDMYKVF